MVESSDGWAVKSLSEISDGIYDGPHATPKLTRDGPVFLGISSLVAGRLDLSQSGSLSEEDFVRWTRRVTPQAGDLVFSYETRLGEAALIPESLRCCLGRRLALIRPKRSLVVPEFLLYAYLSPRFQEEIRKYTVHGSTVDRIPLTQFPGFQMLLPPLAEQRAIAGVLGALDDKIESNRRIVHQLNQLLLAHSISLSTLPVVPLREVSKSYRRPVNPLVLGDQLVDHFSLPAFDATAMPERCRASSIMSGKFGIETTSILISRLNPGTQRVWCVQVREVPAMCSSEFLVLEPLNMSTVGALWLAAVHPTLGEQMVQRATGTSFSHQRIRSDDALSVEVPDIRLIGAKAQAECDDLLSAVGKRRDESQTLARLRDALLPELLSGRLRVRDAESLLEGV